MVDNVRISKLLERLNANIRHLETESKSSETRSADAIWLPGIKYLFVVAIEDCVDVALHICATEALGTVRDNGHAFQVLAECKVISSELGLSLRKAVGFRNILVHEYVDVEDHIVTERLADLSDLREFSEVIARWTLSQFD